MSGMQLVDKNILRLLVPANSLKSDNLQELSRKAFIEPVAAGRTVFDIGDKDRKTIYVLSGELTLTSDKGETSSVRAGTEMAKHPVGHFQPRRHRCVAKVDSTITRVDSDLLDVLLTWDQLAGIEVSELEIEMEGQGDEGDWMTRILKSRAFSRLPAANIHAVFTRMEEVPMRAGEVIMRQGDQGDYYYVVKAGKLRVTRAAKIGSQVSLAQLGPGDAFGEEALLAEGTRNATVTMLTEGTLLRLSKQDFDSLLREPMIDQVTLDQARGMLREGAMMLDVRLESEFQNTRVRNSTNIPLFMLRMKLDTLDAGRVYICCCDTGRRSSAAAYLLSERGYRAYVLKGGLNARQSEGSS
jgi:CRP-like cAMP-binding protein